jgi:hypothetical protein
MVNADPFSVDEMPAQVGCAERYHKSETADRASGSASAAKPECERGRVECCGGDVQQPVDQPNAAFLGDGVLPISHSGHGRTEGPDHPDADGSISRAVLVSIVPSCQIEDGRNRPRSEGDVGQDGMERMT